MTSRKSKRRGSRAAPRRELLRPREALLNELGYIGAIEGAIERLKAQDEAGVDVRQVEIDSTSPAEFEKIVTKLL